MKPIRAALASLLLAPAVLAAQADPATRVDSVFVRFSGPASPGCAVAVARDGAPVLSRAYGMANLEAEQPITPSSIFEAGSVAKQFTAAAVVLLAQEGKLSLDDDVRKHIPELPDYGRPITLRRLITHTSGLRDWGSVAAIGGWPRGTRTYTHAHVLAIARRQRALNYPTGDHYSYTNTGYNLLAMVVERVAGTPLPEFTRARLFEPLGMASTSWRDDYARVVKGRAVAYRPGRGGEFRMDMPFENAFGNGGLLTTTGDLLRWNENLRTGRVGGPAFVREMHRQERLNGGREIEYASGLFVTSFDGVREVSHGGATAGYRAFLARYPDRRVDVALLCNTSSANPEALAHEVARAFLGTSPSAAERPAAVDAEVLQSRAGLYRDTRTLLPLRLVVAEGALRVAGRPALLPLSASRFAAGEDHLVFADAPAGTRALFHIVTSDGDSIRFEPVPAFTPTPAQLAGFAGTYRSDEADALFTAAVEDGRLVLRDAIGNATRLEPAYADAFTAGGGSFRFVRDPAGRVTGVDAMSDRVWALRFTRR